MIAVLIFGVVMLQRERNARDAHDIYVTAYVNVVNELLNSYGEEMRRDPVLMLASQDLVVDLSERLAHSRVQFSNNSAEVEGAYRRREEPYENIITFRVEIEERSVNHSRAVASWRRGPEAVTYELILVRENMRWRVLSRKVLSMT